MQTNNNTTEETSQESGELTVKQDRALIALLNSPTLEMAAKNAEVSESTLIRWLKQSHFATAYRDARREVVTHAIVGIQRAANEAVGVLLEVATNKEAPAAARVTAARTILDTSIKSVELEDLAARVEALEATLGGAA